MIEKANVERILERLREVEAQLAEPGTAADQKKYRGLVREHASLRKLQDRATAYYRLVDTVESDRAMAEDPATDEEMRELAKAELEEAEAALPAAEKALSLALLPPDPDEHRAAIFEIRAGTGGDEAALFAGDLFRMYSRYAEARGWKIELTDSAPSELGGYKEVSFIVRGDGAYYRLRHEGGGHRVQRVPETEAQGRIHTSAATVAVFPEAEEEDELVIRPEDLRIDTYRSGGAGGQHVNKTDSAVRITHLPTGVVVQSDEERSQHQNKEKCMSVLRSKLLAAQREAEESKLGAERKVMIGSGDRSERIRTYNFPQNRLTDHRINLTLYSLDRIMEGLMDELLDALVSRNEDLRLESQLSRLASGASPSLRNLPAAARGRREEGGPPPRQDARARLPRRRVHRVRRRDEQHGGARRRELRPRAPRGWVRLPGGAHPHRPRRRGALHREQPDGDGARREAHHGGPDAAQPRLGVALEPRRLGRRRGVRVG